MSSGVKSPVEQIYNVPSDEDEDENVGNALSAKLKTTLKVIKRLIQNCRK